MKAQYNLIVEDHDNIALEVLDLGQPGALAHAERGLLEVTFVAAGYNYKCLLPFSILLPATCSLKCELTLFCLFNVKGHYRMAGVLLIPTWTVLK